MKNLKFIFAFVLLFGASTSHAQLHLTPYISSGYAGFLSLNGINTQVGLDLQLYKRIDIMSEYRFTNTLRNKWGNTLNVKGVSTFFTFSPIQNDKHKLMIGPGFTAGIVEKFYYGDVYHIKYAEIWLDFFKIRYYYKMNNNIRLGIDVTVYGDDGDATNYAGIVVGYQF